MNCGDFRYLIQRRFDVELSPADDRALLIHLEACESCQRFYHQVQQVIIAAEELEMTEDILPQKPQELFSSILENLPQEKQGMKALVFSFLARFGVVRSDKETGKSELISSMSKPAGPKKFSSPVSIAAVSNKVNEQVEHPLMNLGQPVDSPNVSSTPSSILAEKSEQLPMQKIVPDEQVITRSLSEKFGLSGANSILNNNQPLTLAESIRQKISEMSKSGGDYSSTISATPSPDLISQEPMDEWSIPHSPQWPKLTADTPPEQWPNEIAGAKAPNTWGNTLQGWGGQPAILPGSDVGDLVVSGNSSSNQTNANLAIDAPSQNVMEEQEQSGAKPSGWSTEAEQLETGTWQTVKFDTALGATGYASSPLPVSEPIAHPVDQVNPLNAFESTSHAIPPSIPVVDDHEFALPEKIEIESESFLDDSRAGANPIENVVEIAKNDMQSFVPSTPGVPKIYPVVSRRARTASPYSKPNDANQPPVLEPSVLDETVTPVSSMSTAPAEPSIPAALSPSAVPVTSASPAIPATPAIPSAAYTAPIASPADVNPLVESLIKEVVQLSKNTNIDTSKSEEKIKPEKIEDDTSHLFNFDDGAIDQLFSNNLGVHERSVSTQSTPSAPPFANVNVNPPPATSSSDSTATTPSPVNTSPIPSAINAPSSLSAPTPAVSTPASTPAIPAEAETKANSLFAVDDSMIDRIFTDHLGVPEQVSKNTVSPSTPSKSQPVENAEQKIIQLPVEPENIINPDFSPDSISAPVQQQTPVPSPALPVSKDTPQFGSTPGYSSGKQKIAGVGRLDTKVEAASDPGSGRIASIGKFLLDNKDLEKIGRITASDLSEGKMRTLTLEANEELKNLLKQIEAQQGVVGTVIVGHDGLLIAHTMSQDNDAESLGVEALAVYMGTLQVVEKLGDDNVRQIVSRTNQGYLIIANFGAGLLVTLTKPILLDGLLPLMRTITQLVAA